MIGRTTRATIFPRLLAAAGAVVATAVPLITAASPAAAGPWDDGRIYIAPDVAFYPRDVAPLDGVFDDLRGSCVRLSPWDNTIGCFEFSLEEIEAAEGFAVDVWATGSRAWSESAHISVLVEIYAADGVASLDDAVAPAIEIGRLRTNVQIWYDQVLSAVEAFIDEARDDGYTHLGVRLTSTVVDTDCAHTSASVIAMTACSWCIYDYDRDGSWKSGSDLYAYLVDWSRGHPCTDTDNSGAIDSDDLREWIDSLGRQHCPE